MENGTPATTNRAKQTIQRLSDNLFGSKEAKNTPSEGALETADWPLASYGRRALAWLLDGLGLPAFFVGLAAGSFFMLQGVLDAPGIFLGVGLAVVAMGVHFWWWIAAMNQSQTPGKQLTGIRVLKTDGARCGLLYMFVREFLVKSLLVGSLSYVTLGIVFGIDSLWPLWDRSGMRQTLHDKLVGTVVVYADATMGEPR